MQDHYNLLTWEEEREMIPLCLDEGVATTIWSPLARGRLARPREAAKLSVFASVASAQAARAMDTDDR
jgi:1-deoxyxylulose-5-phosphate synthase